ncbi:MAG: serine hydrolase [Anaerolineaceae bacterium]|nr:serine hydrolase [Anaerolineaceae bacterium]
MKTTSNKWLTKFTPMLLLVLFIMIAGMAFMPHEPKAPHQVEQIQDLEVYFNELTAYGNPSGLTFAVVKDNELIYNKAFGLADGPNQISATTKNVYHWWSTTKIFTAVAIFQLSEQELLNLDDPVSNYLPFFEVQYPSDASTPITIQHLLNHSSGLPDNVPAVLGWMHYEGQPARDQTAFLEEVLPDYAKLKFEPGSKAAYTNVGYMVLGAIIEEASGDTYEDYIRSHILQPLQMNQTDFVYTESMKSNTAVGMHPLLDIQSAFLPVFYGDSLSRLIREVSDGKLWFNLVLADSNPPTGLIGPAEDLARFELAYLNDGELDGQRILSQASVQRMSHESYISINNKQKEQDAQGLGWNICGQQQNLCLERTGGGPGFGNAIRILPERNLGFVLTANSTMIDREAIMDLAMSLDW